VRSDARLEPLFLAARRRQCAPAGARLTSISQIVITKKNRAARAIQHRPGLTVDSYPGRKLAQSNQ
jgi:hypothetical protein